jgi:membrane-associated phospholipid phosphatase
MNISKKFKPKILSIFTILLVCKVGFGQAVSSKDFRLDRDYLNHKTAPNDREKLSPYSLDLTKVMVILGSGGAILGTSLILRHNMDPLTEEEVALLDPMDVPAFDRSTITKKQEMPAGDLLLYGSLFLPLSFFAHENTRKDIGTLAVMAGEVFVFQLGLNFMVKVLTKRVRPYCYDENTPLSEKTTVNARLSFYSGHTSTAAAMSFFVAKVFSDYLPNPNTKFIIWTSAALYPLLTGLLRVDSGSHFRTDSIIGYTAGALVGYFIPVLHKNKLKDNLALKTIISNDRVALSMSYSF